MACARRRLGKCKDREIDENHKKRDDRMCFRSFCFLAVNIPSLCMHRAYKERGCLIYTVNRRPEKDIIAENMAPGKIT